MSQQQNYTAQSTWRRRLWGGGSTAPVAGSSPAKGGAPAPGDPNGGSPVTGAATATGDAPAPIPEGRSDATVLRRDALYRRMLAGADVGAAAVAVVLALVVLGDERLNPAGLAALPFVVLISKMIGLYDRDQHRLRKTTLDEAPALFQLATLYTLVVWLSEGLIAEGFLGKEQVLGLWGLLFVSLLLGRLGARRLTARLTPVERCLVVGGSSDPERISQKLELGSSLGGSLKAEIVGRVPLEPEDPARFGPDVLGPMESLGLVLVGHDVHRVIIAPGAVTAEEFLDAIRLVKSLGVKVSVVPRLFEAVESSVDFDDIHGTTLLGLRREGLTKSSSLLKRGMDLTGASLALALLAPLFGWIALAVKLTSPGPVFFRQRRIGRAGHEFRLIKFRTMVKDADERKHELRALNEAEGLFKISEDPRVTPVGRFLRRTSLDELPQLLNVFRGEMSLVGPRPLVPDEDRYIEGWQRRRLNMAPGMTGFWQVSGSSRIPLQEMVKMDYLYSANWSLWLDVKILLRTIPYALYGQGR